MDTPPTDVGGDPRKRERGCVGGWVTGEVKTGLKEPPWGKKNRKYD